MPTGDNNNNSMPQSDLERSWSLRWVVPVLKGVFLLAVLVSALGVAYLAQHNRQLFAQAENLRRTEAALDARWSRLLLERSTLTAPANIEKEALRLGMRKPLPAEIVVVR